MKERAYRLMKTWCDTLLTYQVRTHTPYTDGALLCPTCHIIHGRIADLCFPLSVLWARTGDEGYLAQADRLIRWSEYNLKTQDGLWYNDITNRWYATSAFSAMSIGETLLHFEDTLPDEYRTAWRAIFLRMVGTIKTLDTRESFQPVSNYYCGVAAVLAMAWRLTGDASYREKATHWRDVAMPRFDEDGLFFGEGPLTAASDGSRTVDMGYNLEESMPLLLRYARLMGEDETFFRDRLRDHLAFLLPDGAIDDSFGTRHNKWTYWGSRTSDGLIEGLSLVLDDPMFADACERVLTLYESCTHDGLLAMPMAHEVGEPTCLHHTFTHAKALAALVCAEQVPPVVRGKLPCEEKRGVRAYQNGRLITVSHGVFRATFSAAGSGYLPSHTANAGGSMNLLYHDVYGPVCAATSAQYSPTESLNQQYLRYAPEPACMTAQFVIDGQLACQQTGDVALTSCEHTVTASTDTWQASYTFDDKRLTIRLCCDEGVYQLPIVASKERTVTLSDDGRVLTIDRGPTVRSSVPLHVDVDQRVFHPVGGLLYLPIDIPVHGTVDVVLE